MTEPGRRLTFAIADLHGRLDMLEAALEAIDRYGGAPADRQIVFLGDYVDRGPQSSDVVDRLISGPRDESRWTCLKGNHEAMMSLALRDPEHLDWWIGNGGGTTIESYGGGHDRMPHHLPWIDALPSIHVDKHRVYVHAGVDRAIPLDAQPEKTLLWKRYSRDDEGGYDGRHVVHGHDPNLDGPLRRKGRTDLDTYAWHTGRLVIGVFQDAKPGGPIDLVEVQLRSLTEV